MTIRQIVIDKNRKCPSCGAKLSPSAKQCPRCGKIVFKIY